MQIAAVILAAGASSRFGSRKPMVRVGSRSMLQVVADAATATGLDPLLAVLASGVEAPDTVTAVRNDAIHAGMSRSIQLGLTAVPRDCDAAIILLADQPTVDATLLHRLIGARGRTGVVATRGGGLVGPPILLERGAFGFTEDLRGDIGLRDLLRTNPELVTTVDLDEPIPDIDEPSDLDRITEPCPGCAARFLPQAVDETHPYIGASPACWAAYGELLAREFGDSEYGRVHRHSADIYAVQHPGTDDRRQRQSVALHLIALCHWLEHAVDTARLNRITKQLAAEDRAWPWLRPPVWYPMTVVDIVGARHGAEHLRLVRRWAETTWDAWAEHHAVVRGWAAEAAK